MYSRDVTPFKKKDCFFVFFFFFFHLGRVFSGSRSQVHFLGSAIKSSLQKCAARAPSQARGAVEREGVGPGVVTRHTHSTPPTPPHLPPCPRKGLTPLHIPLRGGEVPGGKASIQPSAPSWALADKGTEIEISVGLCSLPGVSPQEESREEERGRKGLQGPRAAEQRQDRTWEQREGRKWEIPQVHFQTQGKGRWYPKYRISSP